MTALQLKKFLDAKVRLYNQPGFIQDDPISVPHRYTRLQDIEIAGFFAAIFAWGNRKIIIRKSSQLMELMDDAPYDFVRGHQPSDLKRLMTFKHRTFNTTDLLYFIEFFAQFYARHASLEEAFLRGFAAPVALGGDAAGPAAPIEAALNGFYDTFFSLEYAPGRTRKHIASPAKNASCKRINMFLRWMVRNDGKGVDFGVWRRIPASALVCPVDLHVARVARHFGLLQRNVVDWKAALEVTEALRAFDPADPVKYDFALFGLGVTESI
ncbi:MAG TPA: TIGR02757 family protein [Dinghuibacter sp.]|uniref:TIGR02757 family protein n=1 Tax=Dinghuibacter sp. TaxID=2024697 RepID=UPI002BA0BE6E|nr:TIGR02757 family protein [Dinghuibacter sp.]HTJ14968.1 TIGR02757 family protein [Dinghuibacter sp.]